MQKYIAIVKLLNGTMTKLKISAIYEYIMRKILLLLCCYNLYMGDY